MFSSLQARLKRVSLFLRIAIGNALVVIVGAVLGTLTTLHLANRADMPWLITIFAGLGILISVGINFLIVRAALRPFHTLAKRIRTGITGLNPDHLPDPDPDTAQLATTLSSLVNQLEERNRELHALSERTIAVQEEERKAIARRLHDDTGQALSMLIISLDRIADRIDSENKDLCQQLDDARALASSTLTELRRTLTGLRPTILDDLGLASAIRWYAREYLEKRRVSTQVIVPDAPLELPPVVTTTLFRITQEAVNNIIRHSQAQQVDITLARAEGHINLEVIDNGVGFDSKQRIQLERLGLLGMRERAELLGGQLAIDSAPGKGTRLYASIPYHQGTTE